MKKKIAITGGIGTGKSYLIEIIRQMGVYRTISCDSIYKNLLTYDKEFVKSLGNIFPGVLDDLGNIDRKELSNIVFRDEEKLKKLTSFTNPIIMKKALEEMNDEDSRLFNEDSNVNEEWVFSEVPLLFEDGYEKYFDEVIVVMRDYDLRVKAIIERLGVTEEEAIRRIKSQFDYSTLDKSKYYIIDNNDTREHLCNELETFLQYLFKKVIDENPEIFEKVEHFDCNKCHWNDMIVEGVMERQMCTYYKHCSLFIERHQQFWPSWLHFPIDYDFRVDDKNYSVDCNFVKVK